MPFGGLVIAPQNLAILLVRSKTEHTLRGTILLTRRIGEKRTNLALQDAIFADNVKCPRA